MKKVLLIVSLFISTIVYAQGIALEKIVNGIRLYDIQISSTRVVDGIQIVSGFPSDFDDCFFYINGNTIKWWDDTFTEHTINVGRDVVDAGKYVIAARNIFTTDGLLCFFLPQSRLIVNELGTIVYEFSELNESIPDNVGKVVYMFGEYKLLMPYTHSDYSGSTYIYSLPGRGSSAINETPQEPSPNRKYLKHNQVYIDTESNTYDTRGVMVR